MQLSSACYAGNMTLYLQPPHPEEIARLDALLSEGQSHWWNQFYAQRDKPVPFFVAVPDEHLAAWVEGDCITRGPALDLGCGNGRNALFLAAAGFAVEAVDYAEAEIAWAAERAREAGVDLPLEQCSVFELQRPAGRYALINDSGCFHHLAPHRRALYVERLLAWLRPGGVLSLCCFRPEGGSGLSDAEVYERGTLGGGLGYEEAELRQIWSPHFEIEDLRPMRAASADRFGADFLWAMRARKPASGTSV